MLDNREVYRLGTLILYYNKDTAKYEVVDGQQRMITSVLLLKALGETPELAKVEITGNEDTAYNTVMNFKILERKGKGKTIYYTVCCICLIMGSMNNTCRDMLNLHRNWQKNTLDGGVQTARSGRYRRRCRIRYRHRLR